MKRFPTRSSFDVFVRERRKEELAQLERRTASQHLEREYYFDEGLGQSLSEHVQELRNQYPKMTVYTRRDMDGFAIVKLAMKREYKYELDDIVNGDPEDLQRIQNETMEAVLGVFMPEDPKGFVDKAAAGDAFAGVDQEALENLIEERFSGRNKSKNNLDDFIK